jgi:hypothetical protein
VTGAAVLSPEIPPAWAVPAATVVGGLRSGLATDGSRGCTAGGTGVVVDAACGDLATARPRAACAGGAGCFGGSSGGGSGGAGRAGAGSGAWLWAKTDDGSWPRPAKDGHSWRRPRLAKASHSPTKAGHSGGRPRPRFSPRRRCYACVAMVVGSGGWLVLASGIEVVLRAASGLLQWRRCRGDGGGFGSAAGRVLMRAKAFSDVIVGGHDGGALGASLSLLGASWRGTTPSATRALRVKTLSIYGHATAAPWRRTLLEGVVFGVPSRLVVVVVVVFWSFCMKRAWFVLPWRCKGSVGARGFEPSLMVMW